MPFYNFHMMSKHLLFLRAFYSYFSDTYAELLWKVGINVVTIVHQPARKQHDSHQTHFHKIFTNFTKVLLKFVDTMQLWLRKNNNDSHFTWTLTYIYGIVLYYTNSVQAAAKETDDNPKITTETNCGLHELGAQAEETVHDLK